MSGDSGVAVIAGLVVFGVLLVIGFLLKGERFTMYQEATGKTVEVKRGFSFTYLFFGPFVPLFRGHIGGFFLSLFIELCSCGLARLILLFCYNGMYINWLAKNGFRRLGLENGSQQGGGTVNIQINTDSGRIETNPPAPSGSGEKYQEAAAVLQPVNMSIDVNDDEGETVALTNGALVGVSGMYQGAEIPLHPGDKIIIGRDGEKSNLVIQDKGISRKHCEITYDAYNQTYVICDYSTNGVYLGDGSRVGAQQPVFVKPGSVLQIGSTDNVFQLR